MRIVSLYTNGYTTVTLCDGEEALPRGYIAVYVIFGDAYNDIPLTAMYNGFNIDDRTYRAPITCRLGTILYYPDIQQLEEVDNAYPHPSCVIKTVDQDFSIEAWKDAPLSNTDFLPTGAGIVHMEINANGNIDMLYRDGDANPHKFTDINIGASGRIIKIAFSYDSVKTYVTALLDNRKQAIMSYTCGGKVKDMLEKYREYDIEEDKYSSITHIGMVGSNALYLSDDSIYVHDRSIFSGNKMLSYSCALPVSCTPCVKSAMTIM